MPDLLANLTFERLTRLDYLADYQQWRDTTNAASLKLEAAPTFSELGNPSYDAFASGNLSASQELTLELIPPIQAEFARLQAQASQSQRLRIVSDKVPLSPYLQWELQILLLRAHHGEDIRLCSTYPAITRPDATPELLMLGNDVLWKIHYDDITLQNIGAERSVDVAEIALIRAAIESTLVQAIPIRHWVADHQQLFDLDWPNRDFSHLV